MVFLPGLPFMVTLASLLTERSPLPAIVSVPFCRMMLTLPFPLATSVPTDLICTVGIRII